MPTVAVLPKARIDIDAIWDYIAQRSAAQAEGFVRRLSRKFKLLLVRPDLGRARGDLMPDLRSFPFERYVIFYRKNGHGIDIVRILHSARDVDVQFGSSE
ncbi:MAG: type II toxin-antitoxin system RelE/ParE family toxin [Pseudomonadota bacterium]